MNQNYAYLCFVVNQMKICLSWEIYHLYSHKWRSSTKRCIEFVDRFVTEVRKYNR